MTLFRDFSPDKTVRVTKHEERLMLENPDMPKLGEIYEILGFGLKELKIIGIWSAIIC